MTFLLAEIETTVLPERLAIVGGGYLGIEFAGIYNRFGSHVTVLESASRILGREDDVAAAAAERIVRADDPQVARPYPLHMRSKIRRAALGR